MTGNLFCVIYLQYRYSIELTPVTMFPIRWLTRLYHSFQSGVAKTPKTASTSTWFKTLFPSRFVRFNSKNVYNVCVSACHGNTEVYTVTTCLIDGSTNVKCSRAIKRSVHIFS